MAKLWVKTLNVSSNPSGAAAAARQGNVVMIIDVIDMSTTAEAALEAGAVDVLGASPDQNSAPVTVNPEKIGYFAGKKALKMDTEVIVAAEPRLISEKCNRINGIKLVLKGIKRAGGKLGDVIPNIGKEVIELADFEGKVFVVVSSAGGVAFDAAYNYGAPEVITGTIARTVKKMGDKPAKEAAARAIEKAAKYECGITLIASSSNSMEDLLGAEYIEKEILNKGFLNLKMETG